MHLKETRISFIVGLVGALVFGRMYLDRQKPQRKVISIVLPVLSILLHILPFFIPFFISTPARIRRMINGLIYTLSSLLSITLTAVYFYSESGSLDIISSLFVLVFLISSLFEVSVYFWKWYTRTRKRKEFKNRPLIRRRFSSGEIKMPSISVSTESIHLRARNDFSYNGHLYIRKGETVELLKPIGSYYSIRTSKGTEYIIPKENFFPEEKISSHGQNESTRR